MHKGHKDCGGVNQRRRKTMVFSITMLVLAVSLLSVGLAWECNDTNKKFTAQQAQIDDLKRELEEVKGKLKE